MIKFYFISAPGNQTDAFLSRMERSAMCCGKGRLSLFFLFLFVGALIPRPARAQIELSGQWRQKMQEDWPERSPGPHIGDYTGMPINEEDRMRGDTWDA